MDLDEAKWALRVLERIYGGFEEWWKGLSAFEILVATIISQNTNSKNTSAAFRKLRERFSLRPEVLAGAPLKELEECLRPAGLYRMKAKRIKEISAILLGREGGLEAILKKPLDEARSELVSLPGVGWKTADVVLSFAAGKATFPVDTHIARIAKRWGIVDGKAGYEEVSTAFKKVVDEKERRRVHLMLIRFGREYCVARAPRCDQCPIKPPCRGVPLGRRTARKV
ncbi:MAG: endonuclease III [Candidatus Jordarchaeales archaeon]